MSDIAISATRVWKSFTPGRPVLKDINIEVRRGEMVALIGASGSGKSTLIRALGGLERIDGYQSGSEGAIELCGKKMQTAGRISGAAGQLRSRVGIVFQQFNLVPRLSTLRNVCLGLLGASPRWRGSLGVFTHEDKLLAMTALQRVGMAEHALKRGSQLSGGQQQRAAIARTLVQRSEILIADEPIASLDPASARRVMDILKEINTHDGVTVVVSLHQVEYALAYCPRTIALRKGEVVYDGPSSALTPDFLAELYGEESASLFLPGLTVPTRVSPTQARALVDSPRHAAVA
ncbi:MAG: phosphonate ABC transporter ATP-binding protein [Beijerinckiaceae bacterium]